MNECIRLYGITEKVHAAHASRFFSFLGSKKTGIEPVEDSRPAKISTSGRFDKKVWLMVHRPPKYD